MSSAGEGDEHQCQRIRRTATPTKVRDGLRLCVYVCVCVCSRVRGSFSPCILWQSRLATDFFFRLQCSCTAAVGCLQVWLFPLLAPASESAYPQFVSGLLPH